MIVQHQASSRNANNIDIGLSGSKSQAAPQLLRYGFHDAGNAQRFLKYCGRNFRYCPDLRKWLHWDSRRWAVDQVGQALRHAKLAMAEFYRQAARDASSDAAQKFARASLNMNRLNALLEAAKPELVLRSDDLDRNDYMLNCLNGTLDLRTLELRSHRQSDNITKLVRFNFDLEAPRELFDAFIERIIPDAELRDYTQKILGYALSGDVSEKAIFFLIGSGANGKTTLLEAVRFVLREYSEQVLIDSLTVHSHRENNASLADLADLRGARFVTTSETERGKQLAERKVKYLTGMGEIKACRKYENPTTFSPKFKLFVDANHRPVVECDDPAMWNRIRVIPFDVTIPLEEIDPELLEKLRNEAEGILAWLAVGCVSWFHARPVGAVPKVIQANQDWRDEMNPLKDFLADRAMLRPGAVCRVAELRKSYEGWTVEKGDDPMPNAAFVRRLEALGLRRSRRKFRGLQAWAWAGIELKQSG